MPELLDLADCDVLPPPNLISGLKKRQTQLQMLPGVAVEAMRIAMNPDCVFAEYAAVVERDLKLATEILTVTNSAAFSPITPIVTLKAAVVRLGLRRCQNLILASSITSMMRRVSLEQERICCTLWNHSYTTALLAASLNNAFRLGFQGEEFTAGLIHDLGRTLLAVAAPEQFSETDFMTFDESPEQLLQEELVIGIDHCRFGAWYANQQHLPAPIPDVIRFHHQPELATDNQQLVALIAVADHMANHLQRFGEAATYEAAHNPCLPILAQFCGMSFERRFAQVCVALMEKAQSDSAAMATPTTKPLLASNLRETVAQNMFASV